MPKIFVIGSSNTDMVVKSTKLPTRGETVLGGQFLMNPGGKGANQAVAVARLGAPVIFACKVGDNIFGKQAMEGFKAEGINTDHLITDTENPSGVALILVDSQGENSIAVYAIDQATGEPTLIQSEDVHGIYPRTFALDPGARMLAVTNMEPKLVRDGAGLKTVPANIATFRVGADGKLSFARSYEVDTRGQSQFWSGLVAIG